MRSGSYLKPTIDEYKQLPSDQQRDLARRAQAGDKEARDLLILTNLRLVLRRVGAYPQYLTDRDFDDIMQAGIVGMLKAIDHYKLDRNTAFSTCADLWIRQSLGVWVYGENTLHIPHRVHEVAQKLRITAQREEKSVQELANETSEDADMVAFAQQYLAMRSVSIDRHLADEPTYTVFGDLIPADDDTQEEIEQRETQDEIRAMVKRFLAVLTPREQQVVRMRFGFLGHGDEYSLAAIGKSLGISSERTRQVLEKAMSKMQRAAGVSPMEVA
jgi:RNA polymerase primary sigma factor